MEFLFEFGLFFAKVFTFLVAVLVLVIVVSTISHRNRQPEGGHIEVKNVNEAINNMTRDLKHLVLNPEARKQQQKADKKRAREEHKARKKSARKVRSEQTADEPEALPDQQTSIKEDTPRVFILDFVGDLQATAVSTLREEVTAILSVARKGLDEVLVRLESQGGTVHGYGLAASQLKRIVGQDISLTVAVDKVAASGGYMMACIGGKIIAAPFAILGSIGVVAQLPNFNRLLKKNDIDMEILTAGEYKRTLTIFGENTDKGRAKFLDELEDIHTLFKNFVSLNRPQVDVDKVSTGEAWYGTRALDHALVDELMTSDEYITNKCVEGDVFLVKYVEHKNKLEKIFARIPGVLADVFGMFGSGRGVDEPLVPSNKIDKLII